MAEPRHRCSLGRRCPWPPAHWSTAGHGRGDLPAVSSAHIPIFGLVLKYVMRERFLSALQRGRRPSFALGILVAIMCLAGETLVALLAHVTPSYSLVLVYLPGILLVASVWGAVPGLATAVATTVALDFYLNWRAWSLRPAAGEFLVLLTIFLVFALLSGSLCELARLLRVEVEARKESDLTAGSAHLLPPASDLKVALPTAARRLMCVLRLPWASIEYGPMSRDKGHRAFPLRCDDGTLATLLVPASLSQMTLQRLRDHVVPSLEVLLGAARERESVADASLDELRCVADEQASLRHLATLVAHGVPPVEVFDAVAREMGRILGTDQTVIVRYDADGKTLTRVGGWNYAQISAPGRRWAIEEGTASGLVFRTGKSVRISRHMGTGPISLALREHGVTSSAGCPIMVGRRLWGAAIVSSITPEPLPVDTEQRMADFTELAALAIANAQSHADLKASRARVVAAADETRRRIERDLHDGTQQRLIYIGLQLREIEYAVPHGLGQLKNQLTHVSRIVDETVTDLQEISRGLHPALLAKGGLSRALALLAGRSAIPVDLNISLDRRLPEHLEVSIYYIVSEALTNVAKHAHASRVSVDLIMTETAVRLCICDDGVGGADCTGGSGLVGLNDRVDSVGGDLDISSPVGEGTTLIAVIPTKMADDPVVSDPISERR
jgi:signal transduction histidine kinase